MKYFDELKNAMNLLDKNDKVIFLGQAVTYPGTALYKTLLEVNKNKKMEFPVAEDFQLGYSTGLALEDYIPVSIFPRMDFLLLATNQLVNHLDKIKEISNNKMQPKVIIRTAIGSKKPLYPGVQHCQNHIEALRLMLTNIEIIELTEADQIVPAYKKALERTDGKSTMLVEHADFYNEK
jgi:pyruvate/2-oxoglutarate/acetoin dehydrogenase E1 component